MKERTMSDEIVKQLISAGLTKQQATSVTAQTLVDVLQSEDSKMLVQETKRKVDEMVAMVEDAREKHMRLVGEISQLSQSLLAIGEAQDKYGEITDEKARICVAMYGALLTMNKRAGATGNDSVTNASFIMYAFLGGQAKREINTKAMGKFRRSPLD